MAIERGCHVDGFTVTAQPRFAELAALLDRLLARGPRDFERVMPIDARQEALTERFIVPALPALEAEFLEIREELDREMRRQLEADPKSAIKGDPSRYPKGYCLPITIRSFERFVARGLGAVRSEAFDAVWRFHQAGGVVGRVWGVLREQYFQNAMQFGSLYFDVANDTVDVRKPKIEHMPFATSGFRNVESIADFASIAERYWNCTIHPNLYFLRLVPVAPLIRLDADRERLSVCAFSTSMHRRSVEEGFREAEAFLCEGARLGRRLPEPWLRRMEAYRREHLPKAPVPPAAGFDEAAIRKACEEARSMAREGAASEGVFSRLIQASQRLEIFGDGSGEAAP